MTAAPKGSKGQRTRERLLGAAIGEFRRTGMAAADVKAIAAAAGVAPGTFYFHFPTKEHVLHDIELREEKRIAAELARFLVDGPPLRDVLAKTVDLVESLEDLLGPQLFKDFLALHFSSARPPEQIWTSHPVMVAVVEELGRAKERGDIPSDVDAFYGGVFFLSGLYALLLTLPATESTRADVLDRYVDTSMDGLRATRH